MTIQLPDNSSYTIPCRAPYFVQGAWVSNVCKLFLQHNHPDKLEMFEQGLRRKEKETCNFVNHDKKLRRHMWITYLHKKK